MNKVILMGRLTKDPENRYVNVKRDNDNMAGDSQVCHFSIAVDRRFGRQGEDSQADFIPISAWGKVGEFCANYFTKGMKVVIVGRLQIKSREIEGGKRTYYTDVVAEEAHFAESKKAAAENRQSSGNNSAVGTVAGQNDGDGFFNIDVNEDELPF